MVFVPECSLFPILLWRLDFGFPFFDGEHFHRIGGGKEVRFRLVFLVNQIPPTAQSDLSSKSKVQSSKWGLGSGTLCTLRFELCTSLASGPFFCYDVLVVGGRRQQSATADVFWVGDWSPRKSVISRVANHFRYDRRPQFGLLPRHSLQPPSQRYRFHFSERMRTDYTHSLSFVRIRKIRTCVKIFWHEIRTYGNAIPVTNTGVSHTSNTTIAKSPTKNKDLRSELVGISFPFR